MKKIPENPETTHDTLRLIRKNIVQAHLEYCKKIDFEFERLNKLIKEIGK